MLSNQIKLFADKYSWLENKLFDNAYLDSQLPLIDSFKTDTSSLLTWLRKKYDATRFSALSEAQLERTFIDPLLREHLKWFPLYQKLYIVQGKHYKEFEDADF